MSRPSRATVRWFFRLSLWFLGWKFVLELMIASDVLVLALFVPLAVVGAFALTKFATDSLVQTLSLLVQATIPGIGGHLGAGRTARASALRGEVLSLVWVAGMGAGAAVVLWNASFVSLWVGADLFVGRAVTLLLVVLAMQIALIRTDTFLIDVALVPRVKVLAGSIAAVVSIALAAIAVGPLDLGLVGMCIGLALGRGLLSVAAPLAVGRILGIPLPSQLRGLARPLVTTAVLLAAAYLTAGEVAVDSWPVLFFAIAATVPVVALMAAVGGLSRSQRARLVIRIRELVRARRSR